MTANLNIANLTKPNTGVSKTLDVILKKLYTVTVRHEENDEILRSNCLMLLLEDRRPNVGDKGES